MGSIAHDTTQYHTIAQDTTPHHTIPHDTTKYHTNLRTWMQSFFQVDGNSHELCDSRLFLLDLADPKGEWREGASLPGDCALGQTMDTVTLPGEGGDKV